MTASYLRTRVDYNPKTGVFVWKAKAGTTGEERRWNQRFAGRVAGSIDTRGHLQVCIDHQMHAAHRLAWLYVNSEWPTCSLDHRDQVKTHNAIDNLRLATRAQNAMNIGLRRSNTSGSTGVAWHKGHEKWQVFVGSTHIGYFTDKTEAIVARANAVIRLYGEFVTLAPLEAA